MSNEDCSSLVVIVGRFKAVEIVKVVKITKIEFDVVFVKRDGRVDLRISNGPPSSMKTTPNLLALSIDSAEDTLRKYEMQLGRVENQINNSSPPGTIISQAPKPGTQTPRNTRIHLRVSAQHPDNGAR